MNQGFQTGFFHSPLVNEGRSDPLEKTKNSPIFSFPVQAGITLAKYHESKFWRILPVIGSRSIANLRRGSVLKTFLMVFADSRGLCSLENT